MLTVSQIHTTYEVKAGHSLTVNSDSESIKNIVKKTAKYDDFLCTNCKNRLQSPSRLVYGIVYN